MLERVLRAEKAVRQAAPDADVSLISTEELHEIRRLWRTERQDWDDSVPKVFQKVNGCDLDWPMDDNGHFNADDKSLLTNMCDEYDVPFDLVAKLLEVERRANGMARRAGIQKSIEGVLSQEWRNTEAILADPDGRSDLTDAHT